MKLCVLGAGMLGGTLAHLWARAGHEIVLSSRHPEALGPLLQEIGPRARAVAVGQALQECELIVLAIPLGAIPELGRRHGPLLHGKVVVDACNPFPRRDGPAAEEARRTSGGSGCWTASQLPGARVVKAFNTVFYQRLRSDAHREGDKLGVPIAGDDPAAVQLVARLASDAGLAPVLVGPLDSSARFDPTTPAWNSGWCAEKLHEALQVDNPTSRSPPAADPARRGGVAL